MDDHPNGCHATWVFSKIIGAIFLIMHGLFIYITGQVQFGISILSFNLILLRMVKWPGIEPMVSSACSWPGVFA